MYCIAPPLWLLLHDTCTHSHSFLRACGVLWILCAWCARTTSRWSMMPPRRCMLPPGLRGGVLSPASAPSRAYEASKVAARGSSSSTLPETVGGTWREQERDPGVRPCRPAIRQASGSGRGRKERWKVPSPQEEAAPACCGPLGSGLGERAPSDTACIFPDWLISPWG